jgi:hypothetical protein
MKRRNFLTHGLMGATSLISLAGTRSYAEESAKSMEFMCSTDVGSIARQLQSQSVSGTLSNEDDDAESSEDSWQGVARKDLIWRPRDVRLNRDGVMYIAIGFVYDPDDRFKRRVLAGAKRWLSEGSLGKKIQFVFDQPIENCEIRVASSDSVGVARANASKLGRLARKQRISAKLDAKRQSTMIIHNPESIDHEFGHALGLGHEHTHPRILSQIKMDKAIELFAGHPNFWSASRTRNNFSPTPTCDGDPEVNYGSAMLYPLPSEITTKDVDLYGFPKIHNRDRRCAESLYSA